MLHKEHPKGALMSNTWTFRWQMLAVYGGLPLQEMTILVCTPQIKHIQTVNF